MATIPEFQRGQLASELVGVPSQDRSGQIIGQAVAGLGRDVAALGFKLRQQQIQSDKSSIFSQKSAEFTQQSALITRDFQSEFRDDPLDKSAILKQRITDAGKNIFSADTTKYRDVQESGERLVTSTAASSFVAGLNWESQQLPVAIAKRSESTAIRINFSARSTASVDYLKDQLFKEIDLAATSNLGTFADEVVAEQNIVMKQNASLETVQGMLQENRIEDAEAMLQDEEIQEALGLEGVERADKLIRSRKSIMANQKRQMAALKKKDPWGYVVKAGQTEGLKPLNFTDDIINSFDQREKFIAESKATSGVKLPLMTKQEVEILTEGLNSVGALQQSVFLGNIRSSINEDQFSQMGEQLFEKEPALGVAFSVSDQDMDASVRIIEGNNILKNKVVTVSEGKLKEAYNNFIGLAIDNPALRSQGYEAFKASYAKMSFDEKAFIINEDTILDELVELAVRDVMGPVIEVGNNKQKTISFRNKEGVFLEEDDFQDLVEDMTAATIQKTHGDVPRDITGRPESMKNIQRYSEFEAIGDGLYIISFFGELLVDEKGDTFELDMKKISNSPILPDEEEPKLSGTVTGRRA